MKPILVITLIILSLPPFIALGGISLEKQIHDLSNQVDARYAQTKDFQADFIQETRIKGFDAPLTSSGRIYIKKPGFLRWDYIKPTIEQFYIKNNQLEIYMPKHNQILRGSSPIMASTKTAFQLLQGREKLTEHFMVKSTGDGQRGKGDLPLLTLIPKNHDQLNSLPIHWIISEVNPKTYFFQSVSLHEISGNVSVFRFTNIKVNSGLDDTVFTLNPPDGVVVIENILPDN